MLPLSRGALAALVLVAGCSSGTPRAEPTTPAPTSAPATPSRTASPKPKPTPAKSTTPTPSPTPPPVTGTEMATTGALLSRVDTGERRSVGQNADCAALFPELSSPNCAAVAMDGGGLLWVTGKNGDVLTVRLFVQDKATRDYVERYAALDGKGAWASVRVYAAPLAGHGTDGLVVLVRLASGAMTYDLFTWVAGGPLVLRAHRPSLPDGRLAPRDGGLDEYAQQPDGTYVRRRVAWDGRRFRLSAATRATALPAR